MKRETTMNGPKSGNSDDGCGDEKEGAFASRPLDIAVRPKGPAVNKHVPCRVGTKPKNVIFLDYDQAYDLTFELVAAHGVTAWGNPPFENQEGVCPPPGQGPTDPCSLKAGGTTTRITIHVSAIPAQPGERAEKYRLNFNDGLTCDPIIIIG